MKLKSLSKTTLFLIITFTLSFGLAALYKLLGFSSHERTSFVILGFIYMFMPTISTIIVKKRIYHEPLKDLMVSFRINKRFFVAWLLMPIVVFITIGISLLFPEIAYDPGMTALLERFSTLMTPEQLEQMRQSLANLPVNVIWITLLQGLLAGVTINAVAGFGEEFGRRGLLLQEFKKMKFAKASTIIGIIRGLWHAPLILMGHNYSQHPQIGVLMMTVRCILLSFIFIYITIKAKSVIAAAIIHGTLNAVAGLSIMVINGGNDLTVGITGLAGFIALTITIAAIYLYDQYISKKAITTNTIEFGLSSK